MAARAALVRSRNEESESTRRAILDAAEGLLAAGGESELSIRELCRRARVTPPTIYHHFGDKRALVDRVIDDCFAAFELALGRRTAPADPVERLRWAFDRYVDYGRAHPTHYRLMFQQPGPRGTPAALAAYDRLRRTIAAIAAAGRLTAPVKEATRACWATAHGITSLVVGGYVQPDDPAVGLVCEATLAHLTTPAPGKRRVRARRGQKGG